MTFITPMMAAAMPKDKLVLEPGKWAVEEKFDGHRLIVSVFENAFHQIVVKAWSRDGLCRTDLHPSEMRSIAPHLLKAMAQLPNGIYDGELFVPGKRSYGVTEETNRPDLVYTVFDVLELLGVSTVAQTYDERRRYLEEIFSKLTLTGINLAASWNVLDLKHVSSICKRIWKRDGEGVILKRRASRYSPGKRPKGDWIKIKQLQSAVLTVIGFEASRGSIQNRGPYAMVKLRDDEGYETTVKTRNDEECRKFEEEFRTMDVHQMRADIEGTDRKTAKARNFMGLFSNDPMIEPLTRLHPAIGRKLRIEYQERTPDGSYRHPRWDRWEDE